MADKIWVGSVSGNLSTAGNWSPSGVPAAADNVYIPIGSASIDAGLDALKTATLGGSLGTVEIQDGYAGTIGTKDAYMQFTPTTLRWGGIGTAYLNVEAAAISVDIRRTARAPGEGQAGLYLRGSALATVNVAGAASVGIAVYGGETSTVTTVRLVSASASVLIGTGVTLTTLQVTQGQATLRCAATTVDVQGGTVTTTGSGAITTLTCDAGTVYPYSSGTVTTLTQAGGTVDMLASGIARTITTHNHNGGVLRYDKDVVTITTYNRKSGPSQINVSDP